MHMQKGKEIPLFDIGKVSFPAAASSLPFYVFFRFFFGGYLTRCFSFRHFFCLDLLISTVLALPIPRPFSLFSVNIVYSSSPVLTSLNIPLYILFLLSAIKILTIMCVVETYSLINGDLTIVYPYSRERAQSEA